MSFNRAESTAECLCVGGVRLAQPLKWEKILWKHVLPFLIMIHIALNPFPHTTAIREISFYSSVALLVFYFFRYRDWSVFITPFTLPMVFFSGWVLISMFWALDVGSSLNDFRAHLLKYVVLFLLLRVFFNSWADLRLLFWVIIVSVLISGFHDAYFFYVIDNKNLFERLLIPNHQLPVGPLGFMAVFAVVLSLYLVRTSKSKWERAALLVCLTGLSFIFISAQMRSLLVALPFVFGALFWDDKKAMTVFLLLFLIGAGLFFAKLRDIDNIATYKDRLTITWMSSLLVKQHPVTGIGFSMETTGNSALIDHEALRSKVPSKIRDNTVEYTSPHNMWLGLAIRLGIVGLILFVAIFIAGVRTCLFPIQKSLNLTLAMRGQLCLSLLLLFSIYGLFNVVFIHFLELLMCLTFAMIASLQNGVVDV